MIAPTTICDDDTTAKTNHLYNKRRSSFELRLDLFIRVFTDLGVIPGVDEFRKLTQEELLEESGDEFDFQDCQNNNNSISM